MAEKLSLEVISDTELFAISETDLKGVRHFGCQPEADQPLAEKLSLEAISDTDLVAISDPDLLLASDPFNKAKDSLKRKRIWVININ